MAPPERSYWRDATADEEMQDEHVFVWKAMLEGIEQDLAGRRVLDIGCNRGGFLRLVCDRSAIAEGYGYDPAAAAIADARRLAGDRPLCFEVADGRPVGWRGFDVAFSPYVLYLLPHLHAHPGTVFRPSRPAGSYFAVMAVRPATR